MAEVETVTLESIEFAIREEFAMSELFGLRDVQLAIEKRVQSVVLGLRTHVYGNVLAEYVKTIKFRKPKTWWQHLKLTAYDRFPRLCGFMPVRYAVQWDTEQVVVKFNATEVYPDSKINVEGLGKRRLHLYVKAGRLA